MADYKDIIGLDIEAKSGNPTDTVRGEIWFNNTTGKLSYKKPDGANTWTTGGNLNVGRRLHGGAGTQTAALAFGSQIPGNTAKTEEWNPVDGTQTVDDA